MDASMFYRTSELHGKLDRYGKLTKRGKQVVLFRNYDGFGLPLSVLKTIKSLEIHYDGEVYTATPEDFYEHGIENDFKDTRTYHTEKQLVLPRRFFKRGNQEQLL